MDREAGATLNELEGEAPAPHFDSYLISTMHRLRSKPLGQFTVEDLRICIGQGVGLRWLLPRAVGVLRESPLAEGHFYPGDLLIAVLTLPHDFWDLQPEMRSQVDEAADEALQQLRLKVVDDPALAQVEERLRSTLTTFRAEAG